MPARFWVRRFQFQSTLPVKGATMPRTTADLIEKFQSTLPVKGATCAAWRCAIALCVSIHAPREGSDNLDPTHTHAPSRFNPRSP